MVILALNYHVISDVIDFVTLIIYTLDGPSNLSSSDRFRSITFDNIQMMYSHSLLFSLL